MKDKIGATLDQLDTPQLVIDLDIVDANLKRMFGAFQGKSVQVRVHFKSLKCAGLARYIVQSGGQAFLCAKLNEAEILAEAGITDILVANQIVGPLKIHRLIELAKRTQVKVCVDDADNVAELSEAARKANVTLGVLVEVDIGMKRCGVEPGEPALALAQKIHSSRGLRFEGLQGYDGHLQLLHKDLEKKTQCELGLERLFATRRMIEEAGIPVAIVTGACTGSWVWG